MPVELGSFDIIISMDWLSKYHAMIVYDEKLVRISFGKMKTSQIKGYKRVEYVTRIISSRIPRLRMVGAGVAGIKRRRRDLYSDGVKNFATALGRGRLKEDLESSTWRRRQDF
ncbi:hypothetical protein Tco_0394105 [Tanacetum coccineum]